MAKILAIIILTSLVIILVMIYLNYKTFNGNNAKIKATKDKLDIPVIKTTISNQNH